LRGMVRAVYAPAAFVSSTDSTVTLALPNDVHRRKCDEQRPAVEAALSSHVGAPIAVELVTEGSDDDGAAAAASAPPRATTARPTGDDDGDAAGDEPPVPPASSTPLPDDDDVDLDELVDAPPASARTPIDRLAEAFPGSELIDERS